MNFIIKCVSAFVIKLILHKIYLYKMNSASSQMYQELEKRWRQTSLLWAHGCPPFRLYIPIWWYIENEQTWLGSFSIANLNKSTKLQDKLMEVTTNYE